LFYLLSLSCGSDIAIITRQEKTQDTFAEVIANESDTGLVEDTGIPENSQSDFNIGFAQIYFRQVACPACVGQSGEFSISAELNLYAPTSASNFDYMTEAGTCTTQLLETQVSSNPLQATQPVYFNDLQLFPSGQGFWQNSNIYEYQVQRQTPYTVLTEYGDISNAFVSIEGFDDIQPYTLLWVDPSYAFDAVVSKSGTNFSWIPVLSGDLFEIIVAVYSPDGSQLLGAVSCMEYDVGSMFVPGQYFSQYPTWSLAAVHLIRHRIGTVYSEEINGILESHMIWEVIGTGHIE